MRALRPLLPLFLLSILASFPEKNPAQGGNGLTVKGIVTHEDRPLHGAQVKVYNGNNQLIEHQETRGDGSFRIRLGLDGYYVLEFTNEKMVHKRLLFRTHTPDHERSYHPFDIEIVLFEKDAVREDHRMDLDLPLGIVEYDGKKADFDYVKEYTLKRLKEQRQLLSEKEDRD
jgi:hypothetical protein